MVISLFVYCNADHLVLHSFPTRRSSDLTGRLGGALGLRGRTLARAPDLGRRRLQLLDARRAGAAASDRKSTRLNSSHMSISYAVFCLKKKILNSSALHPSLCCWN